MEYYQHIPKLFLSGAISFLSRAKVPPLELFSRSSLIAESIFAGDYVQCRQMPR
jgi:hypothetical protein